MKIEAYKSDCCGKLCTYDECIGINPVQDMFDVLKSFPSAKPDKSDIHLCTDCFNKLVVIPCSSIDRAKNEAEYQTKAKELGYVLRKSTVLKAGKK